MKALLVSENTNDWELIRRITHNLYGKKLEIVCCDHYEAAINIVSADGPFGFFLIDISIKGFDPIEMTRSLVDLAGDRPLLFIGNPVLIKDLVPDELLNANEYNDMLIIPFTPEDLGEKINGILKWAKQEEFESSIEEIAPENFIPMKLKSFYLYTSFPYDIYLEVTKGKYIRILTADKPYSVTTLSVYAKKSVKFLHILKDDQIKYLEAESNKCISALNQLPITHKDIYLVFLKSFTICHQYLLALGINETIKNLIEVATDNLIELVEKKSIFSHVSRDYPIQYEGVASKSLLTAIISGLISTHLGYSSRTTLKKLFVASILMDFMLKDEILTKVNLLDDSILIDLNESEIADFVQHPIKAAEIAAQFNNYTDLDNLISNHHELPNRNGFPHKPGHTSLTTLNAIFNTSQYIAAEIDGIKADNTEMKRVLRFIGKEYNVGTFKEVLTAAKKALV